MKNMSIVDKDSSYSLSKGGGIYYEFNQNNNNIIPKIKLEDVYFKNCSASSGGGLMLSFSKGLEPDLKITSVSISKSTADIGPGVRILGGKKEHI